jgi:DNA polymerase-3 subunit epsilon
MIDRHRADGDAIATLKLMQLLLLKDKAKQIVKGHIKTGNHRDLSKKLLEMLEGLPLQEGVFYFHKYNGDIIFIGRGNNIQKKVNSIFLRSSKKARTIHKEINYVTYDLTGSELITKLKFHEDLHSIRPKYNKLKNNEFEHIPYSNSNMILIDKGRNVSEKAVILIENNQYQGYGYADLAFQINNLEVLQKIVSVPKDINNQNNIIIKYLRNNKIEKYIRF